MKCARCTRQNEDADRRTCRTCRAQSLARNVTYKARKLSSTEPLCEFEIIECAGEFSHPVPDDEPMTADDMARICGESAPLRRVLFIPDCHVPYHDVKAWNLMLRAARILKPDVVVVLGDFADFYAVSSHSKNPDRAADLKYEVGIVKEKLAELTALGASRNVFVSGNHCDRLERYLMDRAPALFGVVKIPELLDLAAQGWEYVPYKSSTRVGKIHVTHDTGKAGQNAHRQSMQAFGGSTTIGHTHRMEYSVKGCADGPPSVGAMFGWLGDFDKVDYMHQIAARTDWVHGFGVGFMEPNGVVHLCPVPIVNGRCVVLGQLVH